jgi:hypothetical protein
MSHPAASALAGFAAKRIARMVESAAPFREVEQVIAHSGLAPEQKGELWTLAWSLLGPERQAQQVQRIRDEAS